MTQLKLSNKELAEAIEAAVRQLKKTVINDIMARGVVRRHLQELQKTQIERAKANGP